MFHPTKTVGDLAVMEVMADLARRGCSVALPLSEHLPFDLIAIDAEHQLARIQVKARAERDGVVTVELVTTHRGADGNVRRSYIEHVDGIAVWSDGLGVAYLPADLCGRRTMTLRAEPPRNGQRQGIRWFRDFDDPESVFSRARQDSNLQPAT